MSVALFTAGLGDIIRTCYLTASYRMISETTTPMPLIVASHNPFSIEVFRHHRNAKNFILYDLGHKYQEFLDAGLRGPDISRALCEFARLDYAALIRGKAEGHVPMFDAPDDLDSRGHVVFQPFAGNSTYRSLPPAVMEKTVAVLRRLPWQVYIITRSYSRTGGNGTMIHDAEDASTLAGGNITVLDNLTVPASLNLIKNCRAYVGSWSSLQQAAWFEDKPVVVYYPHDFAIRGTGYAFGMDRENTLERVFPKVDPNELEAFLRRW